MTQGVMTRPRPRDTPTNRRHVDDVSSTCPPSACCDWPSRRLTSYEHHGAQFPHQPHWPQHLHHRLTYTMQTHDNSSMLALTPNASPMSSSVASISGTCSRTPATCSHGGDTLGAWAAPSDLHDPWLHTVLPPAQPHDRSKPGHKGRASSTAYCLRSRTVALAGSCSGRKRTAGNVVQLGVADG